MSTGSRIKSRRKELGLTLAELGKHAGVGASTVRKWEIGYIENMRTDKITKLAAALDTTPAYLMGWTDTYTDYPNVESLPKTYSVPILGAIACGEPILAADNIDGYAKVDDRVDADFALRCKGDSMINARIFDGDLVFIRQQPDVDNGEIAAVLIDDEATLKRVYKYNGRLELRPENPMFKVLNFEGEELNQIRILGKAVAFLSRVR